MADKNHDKQVRLQRRKWSIRSRIFGSTERPRLSIFRSDKHIYAQLIDDYAGKTLASAASTIKDVRGELKNGGNIAAAQRVGKATGEAHGARGRAHRVAAAVQMQRHRAVAIRAGGRQHPQHGNAVAIDRLALQRPPRAKGKLRYRHEPQAIESPRQPG